MTPHPADASAREETARVSEVLAALSFALDLTDGHPPGHALRTCLIGLEIGGRLGLPLIELRDLYYASLLKDVGCSSHAARVFELFGGDEERAGRALEAANWSGYLDATRAHLARSTPGASWFQRALRVAALAHAGRGAARELVATRAIRGGEIVGRLGFGRGVSEAVRSIDEHWDGSGHPQGLVGQGIPLVARIVSLAQILDVFTVGRGADQALSIAAEHGGRRFDPTLVAAVGDMEEMIGHCATLGADALERAVTDREPGGAALLAGRGVLDRIASGFAEVVDAKSPFTATHSRQVMHLSRRIAERLGREDVIPDEIGRAALLHDIGKLSVPNAILDKPGSLEPAEWEVVRRHPLHTRRVLERIRGFEQLAVVAGAHHERLDGRGYPDGLKGDDLPFGSRVLAVADVFDALSTSRPYRPALPEEVSLRVMERERGSGLCPECLDALHAVLESPTQEARDESAA